MKLAKTNPKSNYMKYMWAMLVLLVALVFVPSAAFANDPPPELPTIDNISSAYGRDCVEGEIIVVLEDAAPAVQSAMAMDAQTETTSQDDTVLMQVPEGETVESFVEEMANQPGVKYAQPNYIYWLDATVNDTFVGLQWHLNTIGAYDAWDTSFGVPEVTVAVLDTGIDLDHPDFAGQAVTLRKEVAGDNETDDDNGHGTHVSGIIAAATNNATGVAGISPDVTLMVIDVFVCWYDAGSASWKWGASSLDIADALNYATANGADVVNMSLGGYSVDPTKQAAVDAAVAAGVVCVASAGNDNVSTYHTPSDYDSCISVTSTDEGDTKSSFSNYGPEKDIAAPGGDIASTYVFSDDRDSSGNPATQEPDYVYMGGTSMASPVVTGVVALMLTANPTLSVAEVKSILYAEADPIADPTLGAGRVNAKDSVAAALAALSVRATNMTLQSSLSLTTRDETTLTPSFTPGNASNQYAVWTSSNENVVTVRSGVLTALTNGSAVITATSVDGGHTDTCVVTVSGLVESVSLSASTHTMDVDDSFTLTETVLPADATNKTVSWSSSNTAVATVSNGVVQGVGGGSATITATTDDGGFTATCNVTVMKAVEGVGVSPGWAEICVGDTYSFSPLISPSDATNKNVSWTSSNTAVATVSSSGKVTAKAKGTAQITVETDDGGFIDSSTVDVFYSEIKSSVYTASQSAGLLLGIDLDTTADALKANLQNTTSKLSVLTSAGAAVSGGSDVATGNVARLTVDDTVRDELSVVIRGECTGDAAINIGDYTVVRLDILDLKKLSGAYLEAADVNDDGVVNIGDYTLIRLHILGLKPLY